MTPDLKQLLLDLAHLQHSDVSVAIDAIYLIEELERQLAEAQVFEALWTGACEVAKNDPVQAIYRLREQVDGGKSVYLAMHERNNLLETVAKQDAEIAAKQAEIDALMLEYCPSEMSQEQLDNWAAHQRPATEH